MSTRLQVLLEDEEMEEIRAAARASRQTVSAWVRDALRAARGERITPERAAARRLVLAEARRFAYPVADPEVLAEEIARGRSDPSIDADG